jgi:hypothetical protein
MKPSEIITQDIEKRGEDPAPVLAAIKKIVADKRGVLLSTDNSVLFLKKIEDFAEAHLFTAGRMMSLVKDLQYFNGKIEELGVPVMYGQATNPQIIELMKKVGMAVEDSDLPQYNWKVSYGRNK